MMDGAAVISYACSDALQSNLLAEEIDLCSLPSRWHHKNVKHLLSLSLSLARIGAV